MLKITIDTSKVLKQFKSIKKDLNGVMAKALPVFIENTPKKSGNARSKTKQTGNEISANYGYAKLLNEGWSKKSPKGMVAPTFDFIKTEIEKIVRKY